MPMKRAKRKNMKNYENTIAIPVTCSSDMKPSIESGVLIFVVNFW